MAKKQKQTNEERLRKKREAERRRYARLKKKAEEDPDFCQELKEISQQKYLKRRGKKQIKLIGEMNQREQRLKRKQWRCNTQSMRQKRKETLQRQRETTPPNSSEEEEVLRNDPNVKKLIKKEKKKIRTRKIVN